MVVLKNDIYSDPLSILPFHEYTDDIRTVLTQAASFSLTACSAASVADFFVGYVEMSTAGFVLECGHRKVLVAYNDKENNT